MAPLAAAPRCPRVAARSAGITLDLFERQVLNLVSRMRADLGEATAVGSGGLTGGRGLSRLALATEQIVQRLIADLRRSAPSMPVADAIASVRRLCREQQLPVPSISTVRRRLKGWSPEGHIPTTAAPDPSTSSRLTKIKATIVRSPAEADTETKLVSLLYDTVGVVDGWTTFLNALSVAYGGGVGTLLFHDTAIQNGFAEAAADGYSSAVSAYKQYYATINPWLPHVGRRPLGVVLPTEAVMPRADVLRTEFYADWLRAAHLESSVGVTLQKDSSRHLIVSVLLPPNSAERDHHSVGRLQRLAPHLLRVAQLNRQLAGLETRAIAAEAALHGLAMATLIVNGTGRVIYMNKAAEGIVAAGDGATMVHGALEPVRPCEGDILRRLLASALNSTRIITASPGGVMRISRKSGRKSYEVLVAPLSDTSVALGFDGPLAMVFVRDPEARAVTPIDRLRHLYGLTKAEARVMQSLLAGDTLDTIGAFHGVAKETLRSQLKAVFLKTGTSSQIELIRLGLRGMAVFRE